MLHTETVRIVVENNQGEAATVTMTDGTTLTGTLISVNSKGLNLKVDGKTITRSTAKIAAIDIHKEDTVKNADQVSELLEEIATEDDAADEVAEEAAAEEGDLTTKDLAEIFGMPAKELRVKLRRMNLNVGRGARYSFKQEDVETIREGFAKIEAEDKAKAEKRAAEEAAAAELKAKAEAEATVAA